MIELTVKNTTNSETNYEYLIKNKEEFIYFCLDLHMWHHFCDSCNFARTIAKPEFDDKGNYLGDTINREYCQVKLHKDCEKEFLEWLDSPHFTNEDDFNKWYDDKYRTENKK